MTVSFTAFPYAIVEGTIEVPDDTEDIQNYIRRNWDDARLSEPDLDYAGTDIDVQEVEQ